MAGPLGLLPVPLIGLDVRFHARIEDLLAVCMAIIDSIKAYGRSFKVECRQPALKGTKYAGVVDFRFARCIFFNGNFFPLATGMHQLQNVVEETVK